uniref:cAMP-responsive element-binding protein-like 2 n=1 Tax=Equus caballus TaxID=9796 RepID=A0A5F5PFE4_HORSE
MKWAGAAVRERQYLNEQVRKQMMMMCLQLPLSTALAASHKVLVVGGKVKKPGKRGRKPAKIDLKAKLERSRQSARECRARKKLRYQYLEELVSSRERAICALREELEMYKQWCMAMDQGKIPSEIKALLTGEEQSKSQQNSSRHTKAGKTDANSNSW